jgi:hypothetical protein
MCKDGVVLAVNNGREFALMKDRTQVFIKHIETPMFLEDVRFRYAGSAKLEGTESSGSLNKYWVDAQGYMPVALKAVSINVGGRRFRLKEGEMLAALIHLGTDEQRPELRLITREACDKVKDLGWNRQPIKVTSRAQVAQLVLDTSCPEDEEIAPQAAQETPSEAPQVVLEYEEDTDLVEDPFAA